VSLLRENDCGAAPRGADQMPAPLFWVTPLARTAAASFLSEVFRQLKQTVLDALSNIDTACGTRLGRERGRASTARPVDAPNGGTPAPGLRNKTK
jgi:hypothetical protein